jgi:hypothetical protein
MTSNVVPADDDLVERLKELNRQVRKLDWREAVPDELQSAVRMEFNEALAGGPNMNGDAGPTLTPNHALDCIWATGRIASLSARCRNALEEARGDWAALERSIRNNITKADGPHRVFWEGQWHEGPLADAYHETLHVFADACTVAGQRIDEALNPIGERDD